MIIGKCGIVAIATVVLQINTCKMIHNQQYEVSKKPIKIQKDLKQFRIVKVQPPKVVKTLESFSETYPRAVSAFRFNLKDREVIALTLWSEARGEGFGGVKAVASVVQNRLTSKEFKSRKTLRNVCLQSFQFSGWNFGFTPSLVINSEKDYQIWCYCLMVADDMLKGSFKPIINSTHYYAFKKCKPSWYNMKEVVVIGNHRFGIA
jgi:N-acetylmuramoyl-L-alanine amidase